MSEVVTTGNTVADLVIAAAVTLGGGGGAVAAALVFRDLRRFVLPHFVPPTDPAVTDFTLPARVARLTERLDRHLITEERSAELLDERLADGASRMLALEQSSTRIETTLAAHGERLR